MVALMSDTNSRTATVIADVLNTANAALDNFLLQQTIGETTSEGESA